MLEVTQEIGEFTLFRDSVVVNFILFAKLISEVIHCSDKLSFVVSVDEPDLLPACEQLPVLLVVLNSVLEVAHQAGKQF